MYQCGFLQTKLSLICINRAALLRNEKEIVFSILNNILKDRTMSKDFKILEERCFKLQEIHFHILGERN